MPRSLGAVLVAVVVAACTPTPEPTATATPVAPSERAATLSVTASGKVVGPWWMGPGAVLVIAEPGWSLPAGWSPGAEDIELAVDMRAGSDGPMRVTGLRVPGPRSIEPGDYELVIVNIRRSDVPDTPLEASFGCSVGLQVPPGTGIVRVDVKLGKRREPCRITVKVEGQTSAPSASPA